MMDDDAAAAAAAREPVPGNRVRLVASTGDITSATRPPSPSTSSREAGPLLSSYLETAQWYLQISNPLPPLLQGALDLRPPTRDDNDDDDARAGLTSGI